MFSLFRSKDNGSATGVLEATLPVKTQLEVAISRDELSAYGELAKKVNFAPSELLRHRLIQFFSENGIDVYPMDSVEQYLDKKFGMPTMERRRGQREPGWEQKWGWHPLRAEDDQKFGRRKLNDENGNIEKGTYRKIIPVPVLETVDLIAIAFKDSEPALHFFVADAVVPSNERDPFLGITWDGVQMIVIERWDEPAFRR